MSTLIIIYRGVYIASIPYIPTYNRVRTIIMHIIYIILDAVVVYGFPKCRSSAENDVVKTIWLYYNNSPTAHDNGGIIL